MTQRAAILAYTPLTCQMTVIGFVDAELGRYNVRIFGVPMDEMDTIEFRRWAQEAGQTCAWRVDWTWQPIRCKPDADEEPADWTGAQS